jgi:hypothetical protein
MDDLYPSELEVLLSGGTVLLREEKDVELKITENTKEIKEYVQKEIAPNAETDISKCSTEELSTSENHEAQEEKEEQKEQTPAENASSSEEYPDIETPIKEPHPIVKKLFKQVALLCHPDKVKDEKHTKLFLLARTAQDNNDFLMLLFILSRCSATVVLKEEEIVEVKEIIEKRQHAILKKKETVTYKWNTYTADVKKLLIHQIIPK